MKTTKTTKALRGLMLGLLLMAAGASSVQGDVIDFEKEKAFYSDIIRRLGPVIRLHPDERYLPSSVEWYLARATLEGYNSTTKTVVGTDRVTVDTLTRKSKRLIDDLGADYVSLRADNDNVLLGDMATAKTYVHVVRRPIFTDVQFWTHYPYNGGGTAIAGGNLGPFSTKTPPLFLQGLFAHYADWEVVIMRLDNRTHEIQKVIMSSHGDYHEFEPSDLEYENGHFVAYSSLNGHAFYPHAGENPDRYFALKLDSPATDVDLGCIPSVTLFPRVCWPWPISSCSDALVTPELCVTFPMPAMTFGSIYADGLNICARGGPVLHAHERFEFVGLYDSSRDKDFLEPRDPQTGLHWIEWGGFWGEFPETKIFGGEAEEGTILQWARLVHEAVAGLLTAANPAYIAVNSACELFIEDIPLIGPLACDTVRSAFALVANGATGLILDAANEILPANALPAFLKTDEKLSGIESPGVRYEGAVTQKGAADASGVKRMGTGKNEWRCSAVYKEQKLVVDTFLDESDPNNGKLSLREAIAKSSKEPTSNPGGAITFDPSLNGKTIALTSGPLVISRDVSIDATMLSQGITIDGGKSVRVLEIVNTQINTELPVCTDAFSASYTTSGQFPYKHAWHTSAVPTRRTAVELNGLHIKNGKASMGGGILNGGGYLAVSNSTISSCEAASGGGVANSLNGFLLMENCSIANNSANNPVNGNSGGGGVLNLGGHVELRHCTVAFNQRGGIFNNGKLTLQNSIVAGNGDYFGSASGVPTQMAGNPPETSGANIIHGLGGSPQTGFPVPLNVDPLLKPLSAIDGGKASVGLMPGSPAIDGATMSSSNRDQRSFPRPIGSAADIGAEEALVAGQIPAEGQLYVSVQTTLSWSSIPGATYEVFINDGSGFVKLSGPVSLSNPGTASISPGTLIADKVYSWKVDVTLPGQTIAGDIMTFRTRPSILLVTTLLDENDPGLGMGTGNSLRELVAEALPGNVIGFSPDLVGSSIEATRPFVIDKELTIDGSMLRDGIVIHAAPGSRVFSIGSSGVVSMEKVTIEGGVATNGGGVEVQTGATLSLEQCTVSNNTASALGGGIYVAPGGNLIMRTCTIFCNMASQGGGVFNDGGAGGSLAVRITTFNQNGAASGAAFYTTNGTALIENSTLAGNAASADEGGGVYAGNGGNLILRHCTIADNVGCGVFNASGKLTLDHTIVANNYDVQNSPLDYEGGFDAVGANLVRIQGTGGRLTGPAPLAVDPLLSPLGSYRGRNKTMPPLVGSPVLEAGVLTANTPSVDQTFSFRPNGLPDIGSIESRLSSNTDLDWMTSSAGALNPVFRSTLAEYNVSVPFDIAAAAVRPARGQFGQTIQVRINGGSFTTVGDKQASPDFPLNLGENPIEVKVTAQNGTTNKTYIVTVTRGAPSASNTSFISLSTSAGSLSPAFAPGVLLFNTVVGNAVTSTAITATTANPGATIEARYGTGIYKPLTSGVPSPLIGLEVGANPIDIRVTAADETTVEDYTVVVTRAAPANANANLASLSSSAGLLNPVFSQGVSFYNLTVSGAVTTSTVAAAPVQLAATMRARVNGGSFAPLASGTPSAPLSLNPGANLIEVEVTAPDRSTIHSYTIIVTRVIDNIELASGSGNNDARDAAISSDGRFVAFSSRAANLVPNDTNNGEDVFVYDRVAETIERVSVNNAGQEGDYTNGGAEPSSRHPSISADGRFVAFQSRANNLVPGDTNDQNDASRGQDIFVFDRTTRTIERVSLTDNGEEANNSSENPSISGDGRYVAFASNANNLVSGYNNGEVNVYIHDRTNRTIIGIAVPFSGLSANRNSLNPVISSDGKFVAFEFAVDKSVGSTPGYQYRDIFLYNRAMLTVERITGTRIGELADGSQSLSPSISGDGRYVVFQSNLENLDFYDTNSAVDVFVYDRIEEKTRRVSVSKEGLNDESVESINASISGNGRYVAFGSEASRLVIPDTNGNTHVFLKDLVTGDISNVSVTAAGVQSNGVSSTPSVSFDATCVAFQSSASNLVSPDTNSSDDVFIAVTEQLAPSSLADLASLSTDLGPLDPGFSPGVTLYSLSVPNETTLAVVRPVVAHPGATVEWRINSGAFVPMASNTPSPSLPLVIAQNRIELRISAVDGTEKTYAMTVDRALSNNANLAGLVLATESSPNLLPGFTSDTSSYEVNVPTNMDSIRIIPTAAGPNASVTINGAANGSEVIDLNPGANTITVGLLAEDGVTMKNYTVTVTRPIGTDASLTDLVPSEGTLTPAFSSQTLDYTIEVPSETLEIAFTPVTAHPGATVTINEIVVSSGVLSAPQHIGFETALIEVEVTAENGVTKLYRVTVSRARNTSADLADLVLNNGSLSPSFDGATWYYNVNVGADISSLTLTPTVSKAGATVTVNGVEVLSGAASGPLNLEAGTNFITTVVTAPDGIANRIYRITVTRAADNSDPSPFRITDFQYLVGPPRILRITWQSESGVAYLIEKSTDLRSWSAAGGERLGAGATTTADVPLVEPVSPKLFLRVRLAVAKPSFSITAFERIAGPPPKLRITWISQPGAIYSLQRSGDLKTWETFVSQISSSGVSTIMDVDLPTPQADKFFLRVRRD